MRPSSSRPGIPAPGARLRRGRVLAPLLILCAAPVVIAAGPDTTFDAFHAVVAGWMGGWLGKLMALAALAIGLEIGVVKGSGLARLVAVAMAFALAFGPGVIAGVFSATL